MFQSTSYSAKALKLLLCFIVLLQVVHGNNKLNIKYQWKSIEFNHTDAAIKNELFIPQNVIPVGMDVHQNRLFLTFPRLKQGVPVTLGYIKTDGKHSYYVEFKFLFVLNKQQSVEFIYTNRKPSFKRFRW